MEPQIMGRGRLTEVDFLWVYLNGANLTQRHTKV